VRARRPQPAHASTGTPADRRHPRRCRAPSGGSWARWVRHSGPSRGPADTRPAPAIPAGDPRPDRRPLGSCGPRPAPRTPSPPAPRQSDDAVHEVSADPRSCPASPPACLPCRPPVALPYQADRRRGNANRGHATLTTVAPCPEDDQGVGTRIIPGRRPPPTPRSQTLTFPCGATALQRIGRFGVLGEAGADTVPACSSPYRPASPLCVRPAGRAAHRRVRSGSEQAEPPPHDRDRSGHPGRRPDHRPGGGADGAADRGSVRAARRHHPRRPRHDRSRCAGCLRARGMPQRRDRCRGPGDHVRPPSRRHRRQHRRHPGNAGRAPAERGQARRFLVQRRRVHLAYRGFRDQPPGHL
jgi:hypothetical protein